MKRDIDVSLGANEFLREVETATGTPVGTCYQCGKCTAGCPVCGENEGGPREVLRLIQLGCREDAYRMAAAWRCVGCLTCGNRCPIGIEIPKVMDALRQMARREGTEIDVASMKMDSFVQAFINSIRDYGRLFEPTMMVEYNVNSGYLVTNFHKGVAFISHHKLNAWPGRIMKIERLRRMIDRIAEEEQWPN